MSIHSSPPTPGYFDSRCKAAAWPRFHLQAECENKDARRVTIIDEEMATKLFPNEMPLGSTFVTPSHRRTERLTI